ncbi:hypothetical protein [Natrialba asiatica]|uniref:Terminase large subunit n=1 Tax=Natrialba asiatica (strain ATCC 700177 / DSM 12278 / JCM 9576 / FERM P-10747 / NBRC 102637 / 172P1) TaxID=29540 RepID=M0AS51_NATA1|nr:hypothetical protein [Natrialba asiatica]ELZ00778.1 hypothetical protein C481_11105 [Natrialba asiatica DSM 12278]
MSAEEASSHPLDPYISGEDRYVRFADDILGVDLAEVQKKLLRAVTQDRYVAVIGANGAGKSYTVAILNLAWIYTNPNAIGIMTSGSYQILEETVFKSMRSLLERARNRGFPLPGKMKHSPPRLEFEDNAERYWKAISGRYPENLEGRHAERVLCILDECDKPDLSAQHFDSALSSVTDSRDRCIAIGNPPYDESNSFYEIMESDRWEVIHFSSFESHNVQLEAGMIEGKPIPGLVDLDQVVADFDAWHPNKGFPGVEESLEMIKTDPDTGIPYVEESGYDERFYRRRLGVLPPDGAQSVRPFYPEGVARAEDRWDGINPHYTPDYDAIGVDIARGGGDRTVVVGITPSRVDVLENVESPGDHSVNKRLIEQNIQDNRTPVIVDAVGEGSGIADELNRSYNVTRFKSSENAIEPHKYHNKRTEALCAIDKWLESGAIEPQSDLASELRSASRHIELTEKSTRSSQAWNATSKKELKKTSSMGRSPDLVDAMALACWALRTERAHEEAGYGLYSY